VLSGDDIQTQSHLRIWKYLESTAS